MRWRGSRHTCCRCDASTIYASLVGRHPALVKPLWHSCCFTRFIYPHCLDCSEEEISVLVTHL